MGELRVRRHDLDGVEGVPLHTSEQDAEAYRVNVIVWRAGQQSTYLDGCWTAAGRQGSGFIPGQLGTLLRGRYRDIAREASDIVMVSCWQYPDLT